MKMLVRLRDLKPNPFRDMAVDPVDPEQVETLAESIREHKFWGGIACRQTATDIEVAAGWHRVNAAIAAGVKTAEVYVAPLGTMTDADMIRIYVVENATHRSDRGSALAGSVASAIKFLARGLLTGDFRGFPQKLAGVAPKLRGNLQSEKGIGRDAIVEFLEDGGKIPGINENTVKQQLANLKSSGIYDRMIGEIQTELAAKERAEAEAAAEAEEERKAAAEAATKAAAERKAAEEKRAREREEARIAKEKRDAEIAAEKEAKKKADLEEKERRAAEKEAQAEQRRKEAEEREKIRAAEAAERKQKADADAAAKAEAAEKARAEKEAADRAKAAAAEQERAQREANRDFDFQGVSKHLKVASHIDRFRELMHAEGVAPYVTRAEHAAIAKAVVDKAAERNIHPNRFVTFMDTHILEIILERKREKQKISREQEAEAGRQDALRQAKKKLAMFKEATKSALSNLDQLFDLAETAGWRVQDDYDFVVGINNIKEMIDLSRQRGLFKDWTSPPEWTAPAHKPAHTNGRAGKILAHLDNDNAGERHNAVDLLHKQARAAGKSVAQMLGLD